MSESTTEPSALNVEEAVRERYSKASNAVEPALCCPVKYDKQYLEILPAEIIERDYGCGDPSQYVNPGEVVLDLGSGGGKICYIASQIVGPEGHVHGVDMNDDMLALARKYQSELGEKIGWSNVSFHKAKIQDMRLDVAAFDQWLKEHPIHSIQDWTAAEDQAESMRCASPVIADDSIDVVLSNCVLNLVREQDRRELFAKLFRVIRRGGRAVISDIVCDEFVPAEMRNDPELWSGCISGAYLEHEFLQAFEQAGFYGVEIVARQSEPWVVVEGIEFRSLTVQAYKGKEGPCLDGHQAVVYKGPWKSVTDDDGHIINRGVRTAVCEKTFEIYTRPPYALQFEAIQPTTTVENPGQFDCRAGTLRDPKQTKSETIEANKEKSSGGINVISNSGCCGPGEC